MSLLGPTSAVYAAGLVQAEGVNTRGVPVKKTAKADGPNRAGDEVEINIETAQTAEAIRNLKSNGDEETEDDRQEQDHYRPQKDGVKAIEARKPLDVQG